ncbi:MAG: MerR family DNA-binding transcriptional regulator [Acidobacteriota bacterium]|nr:MerR family DNA-binding transcriptional regulator [Acidobacteriota bacterium]
MDEILTISALAKRTGVPSKTLRYWEALGLVPRAARTHTGYRLFNSESVRYVAFIRKSKAIGLTLAEMREILRIARHGRCPCPEVLRWTELKTRSLEEEIESLSVLLRRLKRIRRQWLRGSCSEGECRDVCSLIEGLPEFRPEKGGNHNEKLSAGHHHGSGRRCANSRPDACSNSVALSPLPSLPM